VDLNATLAPEAQSEEWREIPEWEGVYEASSLGRVRRIDRATPRLMTPCDDGEGYRVVTLTRNNRWRAWRVAALVCAAFHGPRPLGTQAAHGDGVRHHDFPDNLRWATPLEQASDKNRHGTTVMGEKLHLSKLTEDDIRAIRRDHQPRNGAALGRKYGVTSSNISSIIKRKTWKHV
jgi:hypothetical protein